MTLSLTQSLTDAQTLFAMFVYSLGILVALPVFEIIHERLEHHLPRLMWDKIGMPVLRVLLLLLFISLVYPLNFGVATAPDISTLLSADKTRIDFLFNMLCFITFIYPIIPVIGKADALMIPLQGVIASMLLFRWLCQHSGLQNYSLIPAIDVLTGMIIFALITFALAKYLAGALGSWLDRTLHREGYRILVFQSVVMIMQSPVIFLYGHALGQQLVSGN